MLGTLENKQKSHWKDFVKPLVHAYNCTWNEVTGFTPYELMFGRKPWLPFDLAYALPLREDQQKSHSQYVQNLKYRLEEGYQLVSRNAQRVAERNKPVCRPRTHQTAGVSETEAVDSSDLEDELFVHWFHEPPRQSTIRFTAIHDYPNTRRDGTSKTNPDVSLNPDFLQESTSVYQSVEEFHSPEIPDTEKQDVTNPADTEDPDGIIINENKSLADHLPRENLPD